MIGHERCHDGNGLRRLAEKRAYILGEPTYIAVVVGEIGGRPTFNGCECECGTRHDGFPKQTENNLLGLFVLISNNGYGR